MKVFGQYVKEIGFCLKDKGDIKIYFIIIFFS